MINEHDIEDMKKDTEAGNPATPEFSPLMLAALRATQFLVFLKESAPDTVTNDTIKQEFQAMIDSGALAIFASAISFGTMLIEAGELIGSRAPCARAPQIIVPPDSKKRH